MNQLFTAARLVILLALLIVSASAQSRPSPTLDELKAEQFTVLTLNGKQVALAKLLKEGKPVVLDFWTTWCGPCRQEIPHLVELAAKHHDVIFLGLNLEDAKSKQAVVKAFVKEFRMNYEVAFAPEGIYYFFNPTATGYRIPQTLIFGADGKLIKRLIGYNPGIGKEVLTNAVEQAANSAAKRATVEQRP